MRTKHFRWIQVVMAMMLVVACKPGVPRGIIQPNVMESILYDYHMAQGAAMTDYENSNYKKCLYSNAVLKKYGITQEEFDSSMVYYMENTSYLHEIYKNLAERINKQALAMGSSAGLVSIENASDTANIWRASDALLLLPQAPENQFSYDVKADTSFHAGDKVIMNFDTKFLWQEGIKDGIMMICATYGNDSITSRVVHLSSDNHYSIALNDLGHRGFKKINGFFYVSEGSSSGSASTTTLKLMFVHNISLVRMHEQKPRQLPGAPNAQGNMPGNPQAAGMSSSDSVKQLLNKRSAENLGDSSNKQQTLQQQQAIQKIQMNN